VDFWENVKSPLLHRGEMLVSFLEKELKCLNCEEPLADKVARDGK